MVFESFSQAQSVMLWSTFGLALVLGAAANKTNFCTMVGLVVNELVMNSIKHGFPGGAEGEIHVSFGPSDQRFLLAVTDDGIGLPAEPAAEEHNVVTTSANGNGLGMRLVEAFTEQAGGELKFERGRKGARFEIWLPKDIFIVSDIDTGAAPAKAVNGS